MTGCVSCKISHSVLFRRCQPTLLTVMMQCKTWRVQARASRLSFADVLKQLAALPNTDPIFISRQVTAHYGNVTETLLYGFSA